MSRLRPTPRSRSKASSSTTLGLATIKRLSCIGGALSCRPLATLVRNTILPSVVNRRPAKSTALRRLLGEVIVRIGEVLQPRQLANARRDIPCEAVVGHVQLLQPPHAADPRRKWTLQIVEAHIEHRQPVQHPDLRGQTSGQVIVHQNQLIQRFPHLPDTPRNAAAEIVIRQHEHGNRRVSEILRDAEPEPVVVEENGVEILIENLRRNASLELVKPEIQEFQRRQ